MAYRKKPPFDGHGWGWREESNSGGVAEKALGREEGIRSGRERDEWVRETYMKIQLGRRRKEDTYRKT